MSVHTVRVFLARLVSITLIGASFVQSSSAGMIGTDYLIDQEMHAEAVNRIELLLARDAVAAELEALGVDAEAVSERLRGLSHSELVMLEAQLDQQIAGGDALGVIGAVFLVLLILELVGVTDVFKAI